MRRIVVAVLVWGTLPSCGRQPAPAGGGGDAGGDVAGGGGDYAAGDPMGADPIGGDTVGGDSQPGADPSGGDSAGPGLTCKSCHGNPLNDAPPIGLGAKSGVSERGVGAHQSHLLPSTWHRQVECGECHRVPAALDSPGHIDTPLPAELTWGYPANGDGATPLWDGDTCANTYCHGVTLMPGGTHLEPTWTLVGSGEAACGTCHALPPGGTHPAAPACHLCHGEVMSSATEFLAPERHVDGVVDVSGNCDLCHGNPPSPARQSYAGSGGAHAAHLALSRVSCRTCHGHNGSGLAHNQGNGAVLRTNVDIVFSTTLSYPGGTTLANGGTPSESYNGGNPTCLVGCHNPRPGDTASLANGAVWTDTTLSCAECHERPGTDLPLNHDLDPDVDDDLTIRQSCTVCHDHQSHLSGVAAFHDPDPTDAYSYANRGPSGLCRTCHDGQGTGFAPGGTPQSESAYWQLPSAHEVAGHDCVDCHAPHGRAPAAKLVEREEVLCYGCHDGTVASHDLEAQFAKGTNGTSIFHHPVVDSEQAVGRTVECIDCHNPHQALDTDVLKGVSGISAAGAAVGFGTADPRDVAEYEVCFKCHGDTFNQSRSRSTNKRLDFAAANSSFHPVLAAGRNTSTSMANNLVDGLTPASMITCGDCHNNEATADVTGPASASTARPQGPHGSSEAFLLRDFYWSNPVGPSSYDVANYALCARCHDLGRLVSNDVATITTNFKSGQTSNQHRRHVRNAAGDEITCANCHYNTHGPQQVTTTQYRINGTLYAKPPAAFKVRGVSFSPDCSGAGIYTTPTFEITTGTRQRRCYVTCHGEEHNGINYVPMGGDDDPLTIP